MMNENPLSSNPRPSTKSKSSKSKKHRHRASKYTAADADPLDRYAADGGLEPDRSWSRSPVDAGAHEGTDEEEFEQVLKIH